MKMSLVFLIALIMNIQGEYTFYVHLEETYYGWAYIVEKENAIASNSLVLDENGVAYLNAEKFDDLVKQISIFKGKTEITF